MSKFKREEKVLVPHTDKQYEARVVKSELREDDVRYYLVHYLGWNKKWDEWVAEYDLQPFPSGKKRTLPDQSKAAIANKKQSKSDSDSTKGQRKRKADSQVSSDRQLQLDIPVILKKQLLDEHDLVTGAGKTVSLPRNPNAMSILAQFYEYGKKELRCTNSELQMLIAGIEEYLDKTTEDLLLYEPEWPIAAKVLGGGVSASSVYGAEHLLRLIVKLPEIMPLTQFTNQQAGALQTRLQARSHSYYVSKV